MTDIYVSGDSPPAVKRLHRDGGFFAGLWSGSSLAMPTSICRSIVTI